MEKYKIKRSKFKKTVVCILLVFFISAFAYFIVGCSDPGFLQIEELEASYGAKFHEILDKEDLEDDTGSNYSVSEYSDDSVSDYNENNSSPAYSDNGTSDYDDDSDSNYGNSDYGKVEKLEADDIEFKITGPKFVEGQNIFYYRVFVEVDDDYSAPSINFSRDDSNGNLGPLATQVNLNPGEQYTLTVSIPSLSISKSFLFTGPSGYDYNRDSDYDDDSDSDYDDDDDDDDDSDSDYDD